MFKLKNSTLAYFLMVAVTVVPFLFALLYERQREEDFVFILINSAILLFPLYFLKNHKIYFLLLFPLLLLPAFFDFGHIFLYQGRITQSIFFIIFDSNPAETGEYIESNLSFKLVVLCILYLVAMIAFWIRVLKLPKIEIETKWWKYLVLWVLAPFLIKFASEKGNLDKTLEAYRRSNHMYSMVHSYAGYQEQMKIFNELEKNIVHDFKITRTQNSHQKEVHVLVIGESTTSTHMGVYGHHRDTTPNLSKLKSELNLFSQVFCSTPPGTMENVKKILTFATSEDDSKEKLAISIVNIMKAAGFKTYWLSNQQILGGHDTLTSTFARQSDRAQFTNTSNSTSYDEKLLPFLKTYLDEPVDKKFIVVHMIGTHMIYRHRYPPEFEIFKETSDIEARPFHNAKKLEYINQYDNAIFYHDHILGEVMKILKSNPNYSTMTYLSDHGEEVYDLQDFHGHPGNKYTTNMFKIPFVIWSSDQKLFPEYLDRKYVSDETIHTLLDLYGIEVDGAQKKRSIINSEFEEKPRMMGKVRM
jgi:heptose-I-phosphate ethanolaminephosphotransferase